MKLTDELIKEKQVIVESILREQYGWEITEVTLIGHGVVNLVYVTSVPHLGKVVVRTPWSEEEEESAEVALQKEATLSMFCYESGLPAPKTHLFHKSEEICFLVSDYIAGDEQPIDQADIGKLIAEIHALPVDLLTKGSTNQLAFFSDVLAERIGKRCAYVNQLLGTEHSPPEAERLKKALDDSSNRRSLLHLDVRRQNIIGRNGEIKAIIDWDNAYIGNPVAELMRVLESGEISSHAFFQGYKGAELIEQTAEVVQQIYRLDTALMLTILFSTTVYDPDKKSYYAKRVQLLLENINRQIV